MGIADSIRDEKVDAIRRFRFGLWRGIVRDIDDPEGLGRVRVEIPELLGPDNLTDWASCCAPFGGAGAGWLFLPRVGDGVWIAFERGEHDRPVWIGYWYSQADPIPDGSGRDVLTLQSKTGHRVVLDDREGRITLEDSGGQTVELDAANGQVEVRQPGGAILRLASNGDVEVEQKAGGAVKIGLTPTDKVVLETLLTTAWGTAWASFLAPYNAHLHAIPVPPVGSVGPPLPPAVAPTLSGHGSTTVKGQP